MTTITIGQLTTLLAPLDERAVRRLLVYADVSVDEYATNSGETITRDQVIELWTSRAGKREATKLSPWLNQTRPKE